MILVDVTHTSHSSARTGIQQLARRIVEPGDGSNGFLPITHDRFWNSWRGLDSSELAVAMSRTGSGRSRRAQWSVSQKLRGRLGRAMASEPPFPPGATGLLCPEIFSSAVAESHRRLFPRINGPRVAVFHDAIPLTHPELTPPGTVARFPAYLEELRQFDAVAAVSDHSRDALAGFWRWAGGDAPPVVTMRSGVEPPAGAPVPPPDRGPPCILSVGTIEGRKNHISLLHAAELLWNEGLRFDLDLVGMPRIETAAAAIAKIEDLIAAGRPLRHHEALGDAELEHLWHQCRFSVYPSTIEGFGLPIVESVARGRPCICSGHGATAEAAEGGGCLTLESVDVESLAASIRLLLQDAAGYERLRAEALARPLRTWSDYRSELRGWMATVKRR